MTAVMIPTHRLVNCKWCNEPIDIRDRNTYRYASGAWFKNRKDGKAGTHGGCLFEWSGHYACNWCIEKQQKGIPINQMRLFDPSYEFDDD